MSIGDFLESLSEAILVKIILVGRLGVSPRRRRGRAGRASSLSSAAWLPGAPRCRAAPARQGRLVIYNDNNNNHHHHHNNHNNNNNNSSNSSSKNTTNISDSNSNNNNNNNNNSSTNNNNNNKGARPGGGLPGEVGGAGEHDARGARGGPAPAPYRRKNN